MMVDSFDLAPALCKVCGDKSTGRHFGVHTCEACKAFYRRTAKQQSKVSRTLSHPCAVRHVINRYNRKECAPCRFDKCLRLGMSRDNCVFGKPARKPHPTHNHHRTPNAKFSDHSELVDRAIIESGLVFDLELTEQTKYLIAANNRRFLTHILDQISLRIDPDLRAGLIRKIWDGSERLQAAIVKFERTNQISLSKREKAVLLLSLLFTIEPTSLVGELEHFCATINCIYQNKPKKEMVKFFGLVNEVHCYAFVERDNNVALV